MRIYISRAVDLYLSEFLDIFDSSGQPILVGYALATIESIQMLSYMSNMPDYTIKDPFINQFISRILNGFKLYGIVGDTFDIRILFMMIVTLIDLLIFGNVIILLIYMQSSKASLIKPISLTSKVKQDIFLTSWFKYLKIVISFHLQTYYEILRIPIIFCSLSCMKDIVIGNILYLQKLNLLGDMNSNFFNSYIILICILSTIIALIISLFIIFHSTEYRFRKYNILGKSASRQILISFVLNTSLLFVSATTYQSLTIGFGILHNLVLIYYHITEKLYIHQNLSAYLTNLYLALLIYQSNLVFNYLDVIDYNALYYIWFAYPMIYRIAKHLSSNHFKVYQRKSDSQQIRYLFFIFKTLIQSKIKQMAPEPQKALFIYSYINGHIQFCKLKRDRMRQKSITIKSTCFCDDFISQHQTISFDNFAQMKFLYKGLITQYLEDQSLLQFSLNNTANFNYLYSLIQIKKTPTQALYEILRMKRLKKKEFSLTNQFQMRRILKFSLIEFEKLIKKNDLRNQNFNFSDVYKFEESIFQIKLNIIDLVIMYKDWIGIILQSKIDSQQLLKVGQTLIQSIAQIEQQLQQIFYQNPYSEECDTIYNLFQKFINFNKSREKIHTRDGRRFAQFQQTMDKQIYDRDNCVIQITLLQPRGTIIKSTRMFAKYLGYNDEEIVDQNIKKFMPSIIAADHDLYLNNFVERGRINIVKKDKRLILAKHKSGFLCPLNVRLKLEVGIDEFGSSALISPWSENYAYVLLNEKGGLEEISQNLFEDVFLKQFQISIQQFKGIDFLFFIPDMANQWAQFFDDDIEQLDKKVDILLYIPLVQIKAQNSPNGYKSTKRFIQNQIFNSIDQFPEKITVYSAQIRIFSQLTINLKLIILEFQQIKINHSQKISFQVMKQLKSRTQQLQLTMSNSYHSISQKETFIPLRIEKYDNPSIFLQKRIQYDNQQIMQKEDEYDLEEFIIYEDDQMIDDQKLKFQSVNLTNSNQQQLNSAPFRDDLIQELESEKLLLKYKGEEITHTVSRMKKSGHYRQHININQAESIGKQSSGNQSYVKRYLKETILQQGNMRSYQIQLLLLLLLIIGMNIFDFSIIFIDIKSLENKQQIGSLPFKIAYFYYEFITSTLLYDVSYFDFKQLRSISFNYIQNNIQYIDQVSQYMSYMDAQDPTFKQEVINIMNYMSLIKDSDYSIEYETHMEFKEYLDISADKIFDNNPTNQIIDYRYFLLIELGCIFGSLGYFLYIILSITRNRNRVFKIFTTFDSKVIQELLNIFATLQIQINTNRFKKNETDEENFENTMLRQIQKSQTIIFVKGMNKVGRQILHKQNNQQMIIDVGIMIFILLGFIFYVCFIFTYYQILTSQIKNDYTQKITFLEAYIDVADAFCQRQLIISEFDETLQTVYNENLKEIDENLDFINQKLQKYQQNDNQLIYNIFAINFCSNIKYLPQEPQEYSNLFNVSECESYSELTKGLTVSTQYIYSEHLQLYQQIQTSKTTKDLLIQNFTNKDLQMIRLYESYGILQIANYLGDTISNLIDQFILNVLALLLISFILNIISYLCLLYILNKSIDEFQQAKQILGLIPFQKLLENAYLVSFIQSEIRK